MICQCNLQFQLLVVSLNSKHAGCICTEGFEGPHCEFHTASLEAELAKKRSRSGFLVAFVVIVIVILSATLGIWFMVYLNRRSANKKKRRKGGRRPPQEMQAMNGGYRDDPTSPAKDDAGDRRDII